MLYSYKKNTQCPNACSFKIKYTVEFMEHLSYWVAPLTLRAGLNKIQKSYQLTPLMPKGIAFHNIDAPKRPFCTIIIIYE